MPRVIIFIESDDEEEGGGAAAGQAGRALGKGAATAGGGEALKLVKPEPVDDVAFRPLGLAALGPAVVPIPPRTENPRALSSPRAQSPRAPSPAPPGAAARPAGPPQPEIVDISEEREEDSGFRGAVPRPIIKGSGSAVRRVKDEPFDDFGSDWVPSPAAKRASVPGTSSAKRRRKSERPSTSRAKRDARGDNHALDGSSSASGAGRRAVGRPDEARTSKKRDDVKNRETGSRSAGGRSLSTKKALVPSEESRGAPGKARRGGSTRSGRKSSGALPPSWSGTTVGSRIRSRSRQQGRVQHATYPARVSSEETVEEDVEEEVQKQEQIRGEDVVAMEVDDDESIGVANEVAQERDQEEDVEGRSSQDGRGDSEDEYKEGKDSAAVDDSEEEAGVKELLEDEGDDQEDSHRIFDDQEEDEDDESDDEQELDEAEGMQPFTPSNASAGGSVRSGADGPRVFRRRIFEGIHLLENPHKTVGKGIEGRTRSKRKCKDKKLLRRGTFSKPYNIDIPDSTSGSEEDIVVPPEPQPVLMSSSDEGTRIFGKRKRRRARNKGRHKRLSTSSDESMEYRAYARDARQPFQRLKKGKDGSNPECAKYNGPNGRNPTGMTNTQNDISFKRKAHMIRMKKRGRAARAAYDELLNSLFAEWENHIDVPDHAETGNSLPLVFSFGDEVEPYEKTENDKYLEDLWRECDIAFESINIGSHACQEDGKEVPPVEQTSCKNGKHEFIIDEQIGVWCKHCHAVDLEIRHVLPAMGKFSAERESAIEPELDWMCKEMLNLFEENDVLLSNGREVPCNFGGHKAGSVWDLIPGVKEDMFPHQQDAFEFMWTKLAGRTTIEQLKHTANTDGGGGCVISHAPGTGKTRLAITFVQSYLEVFPHCSPVIIAPRGMLATWEKEFRKWKVKLPFHVLNSTEINWSEDKTIQEQAAKNGAFHRRLLTEKMDQHYRRLVKLGSWMNGTSIIGVSYSLFRKLVNGEGMDGDKVTKLLLEKPDLLVLDEGHTPRNKKSLIWKVLSEVRTEKRIILSGTPFQNNFEELYNTLCLVRPKDAILLEKDEGKDFWASLRLSDITKANIDQVRKKLDPVVHIHSGKFLQKSLPGLRESVVILNPLPYQKEVIASMEKTMAIGLEAEYKISLASIHPSLVARAKLSEKEESMVDKSKLESLRSCPSEGVKTRFVLEIVNLCEALNERVLVFSQYLDPLSLILEQLKARFNWAEGKEILLMSGNVRVKNRQTMMEAFNNMKSKAKVMLASTKACCEGITLIGASRVVLLDVVWNPSVGRQAIGRAYRIGQEKIVYTYNLIAEGTAEKSKYNRQAKKEHMSKLLFSKEAEHGDLPPELTFSDRILEEMTGREDLKKLFVKIYVDNQTDGSPEEMEKNTTCPDTS
ncbi:SNF2 domain-containing protein CLASSY 4-like [Panicum virgatum]|uniref:Uncharacterized protein n=1 Tax=Panicum virgatum TaxID=38727 RepID=A0A8T0WZT9_PANVG|nr:SNF2 domain-containing protein CLASSY 4-like [Panicum virgatum]KAG2652735.1 hypothetical protein PVAP13_1NG375600 [Panicum virgatum]